MSVTIDELIPVPTKGEANDQACTICEPSVCSFGNTIFYTGNWFAYKSIDKGNTWTYINPFTFLTPPGVEFECDQTVIHDPSRKLTFWILQYKMDDRGENVLRIAVNNSPTLQDRSWYYWDLKPGMNTAWKKQWFDFNHAALSENYLYVGTNMFDKEEEWTRCIIFKLSLDKLADPNGQVSYKFFSTTKIGSLRCTLGAEQTMYFAAPFSNHQIKVFEWPEKKADVKEHLIEVKPFNRSDAHRAICPDHKNWLNRCDDRITAAWYSKGIIGFMWTAAKQPSRPFPFVRCTRINTKDYTVLDEPDIWSNKFAYAWPDVCPNIKGVPGITLFRGGGEEYPDHLIGVFDETKNNWDLTLAKNGTRAPRDRKWGDYLTCRPSYPGGKTWVASGFVLTGGATRRQVRPHVVRFRLGR